MDLEFLTKYITPARIQKYIAQLKEKNLIDNEFDKKNYPSIFKNTDILSNDIIEEEFELIKIDANKIIRKMSSNFIKQFIEKPSEEEL